MYLIIIDLRPIAIHSPYVQCKVAELVDVFGQCKEADSQ